MAYSTDNVRFHFTNFVWFCLITVPFFGHQVHAHPTQFHTAKHELHISVYPYKIEARYTVKVPHNIHEASAAVAIDTWSSDLLLEVDKKEVSWANATPTIIELEQATQISTEFSAPLHEKQQHIRVSNGNLPLTKAFFSTIVSHSPLVSLTDLSPQQPGNGANVVGRWTMDSRSRDVTFQRQVNTDPITAVHHWLLPFPSLLPVSAAPPSHGLTAWIEGQHTPLLSVLVLFSHLLIGFSWIRFPLQRTELIHRAGLCIAIGSILWFSEYLYTPMAVLCAIVVILTRIIPRLNETGGPLLSYFTLQAMLCLSYGTPKSLLIGIPFVFAISRPTANRSTSRFWPHFIRQLAAFLLIVGCLWRLLAF